MRAQHSVGVQLLVIATLYLMAALILGLVMGITEDYGLTSVHSHLGLLGWTSMALTGLVYLVLPGCGSSVLARVHFWLHNIGLPLMLGALAVMVRTGDTRLQAAIGVGSLLVVAGLLVFTVNLIRNGRAAAADRPPAPYAGC